MLPFYFFGSQEKLFFVEDRIFISILHHEQKRRLMSTHRNLFLTVIHKISNTFTSSVISKKNEHN